jgi:predicted transcriptional regulator
MHYDYEAEQRRLRNLFWHMGEFTYGDQRYLVDGFLPENGLVILAGDPKVGKTALASAIALAVAKGRPFAGMKTKKSGVLWLCLEESHQERSAVMRKARGLKRLPMYITNERIPIDTGQGISDLQHWALQTDAGLIVIDPLHAAHSGRSLHDGWSARRTLSLLKEFSRTRTILVLHHLAKRGASRVAESVQLAAIATMVMILKTPPNPSPGAITSNATNSVAGGGWEGASNRPNPSPGATVSNGTNSVAGGGWEGASKRLNPSPGATTSSCTNSVAGGGWEGANRKHRMKQPPRIVTLDCMGRGDFANRTWQFISRNPLDYKPMHNPATTKDMAVKAANLTAKILQTLKGKKAKTAQYLADKLGLSVKTIRNELTQLKHLGLVVAQKTSYASYYKLARIKK